MSPIVVITSSCSGAFSHPLFDSGYPLIRSYLGRLARYGEVQPIGSQIGTTNVSGSDWEVWNGMNEEMEVFSFVPASPVNSFDADIKEFWDYLVNSQEFPADSQYLISMCAWLSPPKQFQKPVLLTVS